MHLGLSCFSFVLGFFTLNKGTRVTVMWECMSEQQLELSKIFYNQNMYKVYCLYTIHLNIVTNGV